MNSSSTIEISKSSLLSLKAEILRKQQEINKNKLQTRFQQTPLRHKGKETAPSNTNEPRNKGIDERQLRDETEEDISMLQKSKKMLEAKTHLYNRLAKGPKDLSEEEIERNRHYLVQFDRKEKEPDPSTDEEHFSDEYEPASTPDDEWVEYVDCLGRTRKCLRKDLDYIKKKDIKLSQNIGPDEKPEETLETNEIVNNSNTLDPVTENSELLSSDMRRELMRQQWEEQEEMLKNKKDVHYQDVLFNEARSHGVGYYAFSQDEEVRAKQQEELRKLRQETAQKQRATMEQKALREKQLAARLKAARNRKRAREGLPPEEDEPEVEPEVETVQETAEDQEIKTQKAAEEKKKEEKRKQQIREWDLGKEGVKKHYEYSQEEWVDKKRTERPKEFAPFYRNTQQDTIDDIPADKSLFFTSKRKPLNPYLNSSNKSLYTQSKTDSDPEDDDERIDFVATPMVDELEVEKPVQTNRKGAEIAPPTTFDYYGPSSGSSRPKVPKPNLEDSIAAGLKYLREQAEKKEKASEKRKWI